MTKIKVAVDCKFCQSPKIVEVNQEGLDEWNNGELIQNAMPELTAAERELLISGVCEDCWDNMFSINNIM